MVKKSIALLNNSCQYYYIVFRCRRVESCWKPFSRSQTVTEKE